MEAGYAALEFDALLGGRYYESSLNYIAQLVHFAVATAYRFHLMTEWLSNGRTTKWHVFKAHIMTHQLYFSHTRPGPTQRLKYRAVMSEHRNLT